MLNDAKFIGTPAVLGAGYMVAAGLLFAIVNISVQAVTMQLGQDPATVAFWQYLIALLFSLPWVFKRLKTALSTSQLPLHLLRVALAVGGVQLWVAGLAQVPIWQAIALLMTSPLFVTTGAFLLLSEHVSTERWGGVVAGFIGGMVILSPWSDEFNMAALYPVGAAVLWALSSLATKRLTKTDGADTLTLYLLIMLTPMNAILSFNSGYHLATDAIWLILLAGCLTAAAHFLLARSYSVADAAYLQPFDHVKLLLNVGLGWLVFGYLPQGTMWLGAALIVGSSLFLMTREARLAQVA